MDLSKVVADVEKKFGKGAVMNFEEGVEGIERIKSGSIGLDLALGGGYPKGRVIEIYGPESSGKTTLTIHAMIEAQRAGGAVGFVDAEQAFDIFYAQALGLDVSKEMFLISQPDNGEQALEIVEMFVRSGNFAMVVVDSVAALTPKAEIEGDMGDSKMGLQARLMSQAMRKLASVINKTKTIVIFINQLRDKIGVMFGSPETTTGGNALKFYASQRLDIRRIGQEKDGDEVVANKSRVKVVKNKVSPPFRKAEFDIGFGTGIDKVAEIIAIGVDFSVIKKSGAWYSYGETKLGQGKDGVKSILNDNPELMEEITEKIYKTLGIE
jgi:recombination protein RecA